MLRAPIHKAGIGDIRELVDLRMEHHKERYGEQGKQSFTAIAAEMEACIHSNLLFVAKDESGICSVLQVIYDEAEIPMISYLFTTRAKRNQGFAFSLLCAVSATLLAKPPHRCGFIWHKAWKFSPDIFIRAGYKPVCELACVHKKELLGC